MLEGQRPQHRGCSPPSDALAIEGLRQALRQSTATPAENAREAQAAGVWATMEPSVMALTSDA